MSPIQHSQQLSFGEFAFDPATLELFRSAERVRLAMQPARILRLLLQSPGRLVSREDIRNELWPDKVVDFEQSINASVRALRRALDDDADTSAYIETLPRLGYRFVHPLAPRRPRLRGALAAAGVTALVAAIAVSAFWLSSDESRERVSPEAFAAYQKGVYLMSQQDKDSRNRGIQFLEQSVAIDPGYPDAWSELAKAWLKYPDPPSLVIPHARRAALAALEIDPDHAAALLQLANVGFLYDWDWPVADSLYKRALESDPANGDIHQAYASFLYVTGKPEQAERHLSRVEELDPLSSLLYGDRSWYLTVQGRFDEALQNCRKLVEIAADDPLAVTCPYRTYVESGDLDSAALVARQVMTRREAAADWLERFDGQQGRGAVRVFNEWRLEGLQCDGSGDRPALSCALVNADLGRVDAALHDLKTAVARRHLMLPFLALYPEFRVLHETSEFQTLLAQVGLTDFGV